MRIIERTDPAKLLVEVRDFRLENGLSWRELASRIGISSAGLWKIAHGKAVAGELAEYKIRQVIPLKDDVNGRGEVVENASV